MSRIFEALSKSTSSIGLAAQKAIGYNGREKSDSAEPARQEWNGGPESLPRPAAAPARKEIRPSVATAGMRIRALSPILPYSSQEGQIAAEQYRLLRTKITQSPAKPRTILVTSPASGDGKTVTAINLAGAFALNPEHRVLLIDSDLRRPSVAAKLGVSETRGLADVVRDAQPLERAVVRLDPFPNLFLLPAGSIAEDAGELLGSSSFGKLMKSVREFADFVIVDSPPAPVAADASLLQAATDGTLLVVRQDGTSRASLAETMNALAKEKILGILVNYFSSWITSKPLSSYSYYSQRSEAETSPRVGESK